MEHKNILEAVTAEQRGFIFLLIGLFIIAMILVSYIVFATASYRIAKVSRIKTPYYAFIPILNGFLFGKIGDNLSAVKKKKTYYSKFLLVTQSAILFFLIIFILRDYCGGLLSFYSTKMFLIFEIILIIFNFVLNYLVGYKIYKKFDKTYAMLYTVLSIITCVAAPWFLFFTSKRAVNYYQNTGYTK